MTAAALGKIPTTRVRRLKLSFQQRCVANVADHGSVGDVGEVALEDPHRLAPRVAALEGVVVERSSARLTAELNHRCAMKDRVQTAVAAAVEPVAHRLATGFPGARGDGRGAVVASEAWLREPPDVAGFEQGLRGGACGDPWDLGQP